MDVLTYPAFGHPVFTNPQPFNTICISLLRQSLSLLFMLGYMLTDAQSYTRISPGYEVEPFPLQLPDDQLGMNSAVQTPDGFLWIASTRGLIIADGHSSIMYSQDHPLFNLDLGDPGAFIGRLCMDSLGRVYAAVSSSSSVVRFDPDTRKIDASWSFGTEKTHSSMYFDISPGGDVFALIIANESDSFSVWKMETSTRHRLLFSGSQSEYGSLLHYDWLHHSHWIQTTHGILRIEEDGKHPVFYAFRNATHASTFLPNATDHYYFYDDRLKALMYWDDHMESPRIYTRLPPGPNIGAGHFIIRGEKVYIANGYYFLVLDTLNHTVQDLSAETYAMKKDFYPGAISEDIIGFYEIDHQVFLLGTKYLYLLKTKPPPVERFQVHVPFTRPDISMRGMTEDEHQQVYASFYNSIMVKPPGEKIFHEWPLLKSLNTSQYSAYSLTYSAPWLFWHSLAINTRSGKIIQTIPNRINGHVVQWLDRDTLWLYAWYGQYLYAWDIKDQTLDSVRIAETNGGQGNFPFVINQMIGSKDASAIWMATSNDGIKLVSRQGGILASWSTEDLGGTRQTGINDMLLDGDDLWYACYDGLGRLNTLTREYKLYKDPMITPSMQQKPRTFFTILPDDHRGFYLGSQQGLVYFDTTVMAFSHLDPEHPLSRPEFNRTSAYRDRQGNYYFGSTNGLYMFLPEDLQFQEASKETYPIKLYGIAIFNGEDKQYRYVVPAPSERYELTLRPSDTNMEFFLSAPGFDQTIYYSYRIQGIHDDWSDYAANPKILVYALPPGQYNLEVKASANAEDSNAVTFSLPIHMTAYWYQHAWVWVLLSVIISLLGVLGVRYWYQQRWKRQKSLEALRIKISSDLHDDVGSILTGLAMQSQMMSYEVEEAKRKPLLELSEMSREAMDRMRDTVWAIDARKDKFENLVDRMRDYVEKNLERKSISHSFLVRDIEGKKFISPEVRQNIYLIFKEAVTNIIRHSDATHVEVTFQQIGDKVILAINDNGRATSPNAPLGQGIANMKMRSERIGGTLKISTDHGYKIELVLG